MKNIIHKFWYIIRDENGEIESCAIRLFEGTATTAQVYDDDNVTLKDVTRFTPEKALQNADLGFLGHSTHKVNPQGHQCPIFNKADFGNITDKDELVLFLNQRIANDSSRAPVNPQDIVDSVASIKAARNSS